MAQTVSSNGECSFHLDHIAQGEPSETITPSGRKVLLFNDHIYSELRVLAGVPDNFTNTGWNFLQDFAGGGGKGGTLMARIGTQYIVKELSLGDHKVLLEITPAYSEHIRRVSETLLCPMYLHFKDVESGRLFFAMENVVGGGELTALYDLKGCADDKALVLDGQKIEAVHKRVWNIGMWCSKSSWSPARKKYHDGKMSARSLQLVLGTMSQRSILVQCIERDCEFLAKLRLMDYSLIVAIKQGPSSSPNKAGPSAGQFPMVMKGTDGQDFAVHVGIIDFLQLWTTGKKVARVIKSAECNKATIPPKPYANRFSRHLRLCFTAFADGEEGSAGAKQAADLSDVLDDFAPTWSRRSEKKKTVELTPLVEPAPPPAPTPPPPAPPWEPRPKTLSHGPRPLRLTKLAAPSQVLPLMAEAV